MTLELNNLEDSGVREKVLAEFDRDVAADELFLSERLSPEGAAAYPGLLREAIQGGTDGTLQLELEGPGMLNSHDKPHMRQGKLVTPKMNKRAPQMIAEGEFNRFYIRGLCLVIQEEDSNQVEVYRARESTWARPESEALIGQLLDAADLLIDLRTHIGEEPTLLPDVNSGLSIRKLK
jgi:hypothetical protein